MEGSLLRSTRLCAAQHKLDNEQQKSAFMSHLAEECHPYHPNQPCASIQYSLAHLVVT